MARPRLVLLAVAALGALLGMAAPAVTSAAVPDAGRSSLGPPALRFVPADGATSTSLAAVVRDASGAPAADTAVTLKASVPGEFTGIPPEPLVECPRTDTGGATTCTVRSRNPGPVDLQLVDAATGAHLGAPQRVEFTRKVVVLASGFKSSLQRRFCYWGDNHDEGAVSDCDQFASDVIANEDTVYGTLARALGFRPNRTPLGDAGATVVDVSWQATACSLPDNTTNNCVATIVTDASAHDVRWVSAPYDIGDPIDSSIKQIEIDTWAERLVNTLRTYDEALDATRGYHASFYLVGHSMGGELVVRALGKAIGDGYFVDTRRRGLLPVAISVDGAINWGTLAGVPDVEPFAPLWDVRHCDSPVHTVGFLNREQENARNVEHASDWLGTTTVAVTNADDWLIPVLGIAGRSAPNSRLFPDVPATGYVERVYVGSGNPRPIGDPNCGHSTLLRSQDSDLYEGVPTGVDGGYTRGAHVHFPLGEIFQEFIGDAVTPTTSPARCPGPGLVSPAEGAIVIDHGATFSWNALSGCTFDGYTLRVRTDTHFDARGDIADQQLAGTSASVTIPTQYDGQTLYWGVRAANAPAGADWSVRSLTPPGCDTVWRDPVSGDWSNGQRWTNGVPGATQRACVTTQGDYVVTIRASATAKVLTNTGTLDIQASLTITGQLTNTGTLTVAGGTTLGGLANSGTLTVASGQRLVVEGASWTQSGGKVDNQGTIWAHLTTVTVSGGTFTGNDVQIDSATLALDPAFQNPAGFALIGAGTIRLTSDIPASVRLTMGTDGWNLPVTLPAGLTNRGTMILSGIKTVTLSVDNAGALTNAGTFRNTGTGGRSITGQLTNTGTLDIQASLTITGQLTNTGTLTVAGGTTLGGLANSGTLTVASGQRLVVEGASWTQSGGKVDNQGTIWAHLTTVTVSGGTFTGNDVQIDSATLALDPAFQNPAGFALIGAGTIRLTSDIPASVRLTMGTDGWNLPVTLPAGLTNRGTMILSGIKTVTLSVDNAGALTNAGTFRNTGTGGRSITGQLTNTGTLDIQASLTITGQLTNTGTLTVAGGTTLGGLANSGTLTVASGQRLVVEGASWTQSGGKVDNQGTIWAHLTTVTVSGGTFTGNDVQIDSATLALDPAFQNPAGFALIGAGTIRLTSDIPASVRLTMGTDGWNLPVTLPAGLTNRGTMILSGIKTVTLSVDNAGALTNAGTFRNTGTGGRSITGQLTNTGTLDIQASLTLGGLANSGTLTVASGQRLVVEGASWTQSGGKVDNQGTIWAHLTTVTVSGGTFTGNDVQIDSATLALDPAFQNPAGFALIGAGTIRLTSDIPASVRLTMGTDGWNLPVTLPAGLTNRGTMILSGIKTVTLSVDNAGALTNAGTFRNTGTGGRSITGQLTNTGTLDIQASLTITGQLTNTGTLTVAGGTTLGGLANSGTLTVASGQRLVVEGASWTQSGGKVDNQGTIWAHLTTVTVSGGTFTGNDVQIDSATLALDPAFQNPAGFALIGAGTIRLTSDIPASVRLTMGTDGWNLPVTLPAGLTNRGTMILSGIKTVTLSVDNAGALTNAGTFRNTGTGGRSITGQLTNTGTLDIQASLTLGGLANSGTLTVASGQRLVVEGASWTQSGGKVDNQGTIWAHLTTVTVSGGTFTGNDVQIDSATLALDPAFQNPAGFALIGAGTIRLTSDIPASVRLTMGTDGWNLPVTLPAGLTNRGTMILSGIKTVTLSVDNAGALTNAGTFRNTGTGGRSITGQLTNTGTLDIQASLTITGQLTNTGTLTVAGGTTLGGLANSGTLTVASGQRLVVEGASWTQSGGKVDNQGTIWAHLTTVTVSGGTFTGNDVQIDSATLALDPAFQNPAGFALIGAGTIRLTSDIPASVRLTMGTDGWNLPVTLPAGLTNRGTMILSGIKTVTLSVDNAGALTNAGTFRNTGTGGRSITGQLTNTGTLDIQASLTITGQLTNTGTVTVAGGNLTIGGASLVQTAGSIAVASSGTLSTPILDLRGGMLTGTGIISGGLRNSGGVVSPGPSFGTLTVQGAYTQLVAGRLRMELSGTAAGQFDVLRVTGAATMDGALEVVRPQYVPGDSDTFAVMASGSRTGTFARLTGSDVSASRRLVPDYAATGMTLRLRAPSVPSLALDLPAVSATRDVAVDVVATDPDSVGIDGWYLSASSDRPGTSDPGWLPVRPTTFTFPSPDGGRTLYAWVKDGSGAVSSTASDSVLVDTTPPTVSLDAPTTTPTRLILVTVAGSDPGGAAASGIEGWALVEGGTSPPPDGPAWLASPPTSFMLSLGDGPKTLGAFSRDAAGNISPVATKVVTLALVGPSVSLGLPPVSASRSVPVSLSATAAPGTSIAGWLLSESATPPSLSDPAWRTAKPTSFTFPAGDGTRTLRAWVKDATGVLSEPDTASVVIDTTRPTVTLAAPSSARRRTIAVTVGGSDGTGSGISAWALVEGTAAPATGDPAWVASAPTAFQLSATDGAKTLSAFSRDAAGNVSLPATAAVVLDTRPPVVSLDIVPVLAPSLTVAVSLSTTTPAGIAVAGWFLAESATTPAADDPGWLTDKPTSYMFTPGEGQRTLRAWVKDASNVISAPAIDSVSIDTRPPSATLSAPGVTNARDIAVTIGGADGTGSGIAVWALVEGTSAPATGDAAWVTSKPTSFRLSAGDGSKTVSAFSRDAAGNVSDPASATVLLDTVKPTVSLDAPATTRTRTIALTVDGSDTGGSGITAWALVAGSDPPAASDPAWVASPPTSFELSAGDGAKTVSAFARDAAGNVSDAATASVTLDTRPPVVSLDIGPALTNAPTVPATLSATAPAGTTVAAWYLSESATTPAAGDPGWVSDKPTSFTFTPGDGSRTLHAWVKDGNGTVSEPASDGVVIDTTRPTITLTAPVITNHRDIAVTVGGSDAGGSGITAWALVEGTAAPGASDPAWTATAPTSFQLSSVDASKTVSAFSKDAAGNLSDPATRSVTLDTTQPTVTLDAPSTTPTRTITVTLGGSDPGGSGITAWALVEGTSAPAPADPAWVGTKPTTFTLSRVNGDRTISAFSRDAAGNVSAAASRTVTLAAPVPTVTLGLPAATNDRVVPVTLDTVDPAGVGISRWIVSEDATAPTSDDPRWSDTLPATVQVSAGEGTRTISAWVRDANGNPSARSQGTVLLDTTAPTAGIVIDGDAPTTPDRDVTLTITADDPGGSGVSRMRFSDDGTSFTELEPYAATRAWTLPPGPGDHTVWVRVRDAAGNVATASDTIALAVPSDTTPPVASPPVAVLLGTGTLGTTTRVRVTWPAATDDVGVTAYVLQRKTGTGAWTDVPLASPLARTVDIAVAPGTTTTSLRLRALDAADNASDWQAPPALTVSLTQETATAIHWTGAWTSTPLTGASGGKVRWAKAAGRRATLAVTGSSVALVSARGRDRGKAEVWVDGARVATLDLHAATTKVRQVVWAGSLAPGPHTVQLRVLGTRRTAATSTRVDLDAWLVLR